MRTITFLQPKRLTFGNGCLAECLDYLAALPSRGVHIVSSPSHGERVQTIADELRAKQCRVSVDCTIATEPTVEMFSAALTRARMEGADCILGLGGGSVLDLAKLIAAFSRSDQQVEDTFGIGLLAGRACHLVCVPTTAGTGSEVSPNAILLDETARLKKGVISPWLVPDAAFVDPLLTMSMPAEVTASTGLDALTHCIEAYTNLHAHPLVDVYALEGIALCARHLAAAVRDVADREAREGMALASLYGGLCLGPVNTAAVHALAYPLGGEFHIPHGLSNALLLPAVFRFNAEASPARHARVALALGAADQGDDLRTAQEGAQLLRELSVACGVTGGLHDYGLDRSVVPELARAAMTVTRLLRNNPRTLTQADAEAIYLECFDQEST